MMDWRRYSNPVPKPAFEFWVEEAVATLNRRGFSTTTPTNATSDFTGCLAKVQIGPGELDCEDATRVLSFRTLSRDGRHSWLFAVGYYPEYIPDEDEDEYQYVPERVYLAGFGNTWKDQLQDAEEVASAREIVRAVEAFVTVPQD